MAAAQARSDAAALFQPTLAPLAAAPALQRQLGRFTLTGEASGVRERDDTLWVFEAFPHRKAESDLGFGDVVPLYLTWALLRLAPENAKRRVRLCALLPKGGTPWQDAVNAWDDGFVAAGKDLRETLAASLATGVLALLEEATRLPTHPAWFFPYTARAALAGKGVEDTWERERSYAPGYARLLGRGLAPEPGSEDAAALLRDATRLAELVQWPHREAE